MDKDIAGLLVELIEKVGSVLADELKAKGAHILLAPTVNIHRTPIAGRNSRG